MTAQLIIPMTGVSSRFTAAGYTKPKFLLEVDGKTVIEHVIDMYPGWTDVVFACNEQHLGDPSLGLRELLLDLVPTGRIVSLPSERKGPAWAVLQCRDLIALDRPVVVNYCDFAAVWDTASFADLLAGGTVAGAIPCYTGFHPHMAFSTSYAYVRLGQDDQVLDIQEKQPWTDDPMSERASSGTYGFDSGRRMLAAIEEQIRRGDTLNDEYYLSLTYKSMLAAGDRVTVFPVPYFMQWGTPQDFEEYREYSRALVSWTTREPEAAEEDLSRVVLAAGAGDRFRRAGYSVPKPALTLSGRSLLEHAVAAVPGGHTVIVSRTDLADSGVVDQVADRIGATVAHLPGLSSGQAASALRGLAEVDPELPATVAACDAVPVVSSAALRSALELAGDSGLVCWVAPRYSLAARKPQQYGWVEWDAQGRVGRSWLKEAPTEPGAGVLIGTFTFGTAAAGTAHIQALIADGVRINGEFYLDSLVPHLLGRGVPVIALQVESFVSVGTPDEYESVRYWQACFHGWPAHPYTLDRDPMVDEGVRPALDRELRAPFRTQAG